MNVNMIKLIKSPSNFASYTKITQRVIGSLNGELAPEFKVPEDEVKMPTTPEKITGSSLAATVPNSKLFARSGGFGGE